MLRVTTYNDLAADGKLLNEKTIRACGEVIEICICVFNKKGERSVFTKIVLPPRAWKTSFSVYVHSCFVLLYAFKKRSKKKRGKKVSIERWDASSTH